MNIYRQKVRSRALINRRQEKILRLRTGTPAHYVENKRRHAIMHRRILLMALNSGSLLRLPLSISL